MNLGLLIISSVLFLLCHVTFPAKMPHLSNMVMSFQYDLEAGILLGVQREIKTERGREKKRIKKGGWERGEEDGGRIWSEVMQLTLENEFDLFFL